MMGKDGITAQTPGRQIQEAHPVDKDPASAERNGK